MGHVTAGDKKTQTQHDDLPPGVALAMAEEGHGAHFGELMNSTGSVTKRRAHNGTEVNIEGSKNEKQELAKIEKQLAAKTKLLSKERTLILFLVPNPPLHARHVTWRLSTLSRMSHIYTEGV